MHKLTRPTPPACLGRYMHGRDHWRSVTSAHKSEIWLKIDEMQQLRCAYCEAEIKTSKEDSNSHIEHFRQRSRHPADTFRWNNMFGSCNREDSCGKHKDRQPVYPHLDLIKMDVEDPDRYLFFLPDGNVAAKKGLNPREKTRAEETIRLFNLNGSLRQIRETMIKGYLQTAEEFAEMAAEFSPEDWQPLVEEELAAIEHLPFATAIKHVLLPE